MIKFVDKHINLALVLTVCISFIFLTVTLINAYLVDEANEKNKVSFGTVSMSIIEEFEPPETLVPGITFKKDVSVKNDGLSDCYVRMHVLFSNSKIEQYCTLDINNTAWELGQDGYYYCKNRLAADETTESLFTEVSLAEGNYGATLTDFEIIVYGECVQAGNYNTYEQAWANFEKNSTE